MGGETNRRDEFQHDIETYLSRRQKLKPFTIKPSRRSSWHGWPHQPPRDVPGRTQTRASTILERQPSWWEGIKATIKTRIYQDLQRITAVGGITMKQPEPFLDLEDGGLTVVPIPEEPETVVKAPPSVQPAPTAPSLQPPRTGWFSRWFSTRNAVKEEQLLDGDFLITAPSAIPAAPAADHELREDFKELAKLCLKNLERMNKDQLSQFKSTSEFERFKELLRKHQVIK